MSSQRALQLRTPMGRLIRPSRSLLSVPRHLFATGNVRPSRSDKSKQDQKGGPRISRHLTKIGAGTPIAKRVGAGYDWKYGAITVSKKLLLFRRKVNEGLWCDAMEMYPTLLENSIMTHNDTLYVAKMLHNEFRTLSRRSRPTDTFREEAEMIHKHIQTLISDMKLKQILPHPVAGVHILSYFKESHQYEEGLGFWKWLVNQDDTYLDLRTYGAAIELLAFQGQPLEYLEELYTQALKRFPGEFSAYHLSPGSIISNSAAQAYTPGSKMMLLQGILTARILHGDWQNSYLALDTALRLHPDDLPTRFFQLFLYERPSLESYKVFQIACRSGNKHLPRTLMSLLSRLRRDAVDVNAAAGHPLKTYKLEIAQGMLNALSAHLGVGGQLSTLLMNKIIQGMLTALPGGSEVERESRKSMAADLERLDEEVLSAVRNLIGIFSGLGFRPNATTFNTIMTMACDLGRDDLVIFCHEQLQRVGPVRLEDKFYFLSLKAARTVEGIEAVWANIVSFNDKKSDHHDRDKWHWLIYSCSQTNNMEFARSQVAQHVPTMPLNLQNTVKLKLTHFEKEMKATDSQKSEETTGLDEATARENLGPPDRLETLQSLVIGLNAAVERIREIACSGVCHNFQESPIPLDLHSYAPEEALPGYLRQLYKVMTTDPNWTGTSSQKENFSRTGFPLGKLRYQNWKAVNELLVEAKRFESKLGVQIDRAIESGNPLQKPTHDTSFLVEDEAKVRIRKNKGHLLYQPGTDVLSNPATIDIQWPNQLPQWIKDSIILRRYEGKIPPYHEMPDAVAPVEETSDPSLANNAHLPAGEDRATPAQEESATQEEPTALKPSA